MPVSIGARTIREANVKERGELKFAIGTQARGKINKEVNSFLSFHSIYRAKYWQNIGNQYYRKIKQKLILISCAHARDDDGKEVDKYDNDRGKDDDEEKEVGDDEADSIFLPLKKNKNIITGNVKLCIEFKFNICLYTLEK